jgi:hypothetical protein
MPMGLSPDKCLVQDTFLWPVLEIKSEDDSGMVKNIQQREINLAMVSLYLLTYWGLIRVK